VIVQNKFLKFLLYFLGAVLISALGGGLWDLALWPFLQWTNQTIIEFLIGLSTGFSNYLYRGVGGLRESFYAWKTLGFMLLILVTLPLIYYSYWRLESVAQQASEFRDKLRKIRYRMVLLMLLAIAGAALFAEGREYYTYQLRSQMANSIEIVAPYVPTQALLQLKSDFRGIKSKKDYEQLKIQLERIAADNNKELFFRSDP